jgi:hypothetical protein
MKAKMLVFRLTDAKVFAFCLSGQVENLDFKIEKSDFFEKIRFLGRGQLDFAVA